jgi:hypothetical protein
MPCCQCNGERPVCGYCEQSNHPCQYAVPEGMTVRQALVHKSKGLAESNRALYTAFEKLRDDGPAAADVLRRIREAPSTDAAIRSISDALLLLPSSTSNAVTSTEQSASATNSKPSLRQAFFYSPKASRRFDYKRARASVTFGWPKVESLGVNDGLNGIVVNVATESLPISKWTRASDDDVHLTHLFNLFWSWDNTISRVIDRDIFIADLKNVASPSYGRSTSGGEFCSSFMVNALLALASVCSNNSLSNQSNASLTSFVDVFVRREGPRRARRCHDERASLRRRGISAAREREDIFTAIFNPNTGHGFSMGVRIQRRRWRPRTSVIR